LALIFVEVLINFTVSAFEFQQVWLSWLYGYWWVAPNSPKLNPLDYEVRGNDGVVIQPAIKVKNSSRVQKCTLVNLVCLTAESAHWQLLWKTATTDRRRVLANGGHFGTFNMIIFLTDTNCYI